MLLRTYANNEGLDYVQVLKLIPDGWPLYDQKNYHFLKNVFDYKLTVSENCQIGENLSSVEHLNTEIGVSERKKNYIKLTPNSTCGVCKTRLDIK